jgi:tetratricopeptide (TPR) repeat protein
MTNESRNESLDALLEKFEAERRKRIKRYILFLLIPVLFTICLVAYSIYLGVQTENLKTKTEELQPLRHVFEEQKKTLDDVRTQLTRTRAAAEYIRIGVNNFHAKNFAAAVRAYDRAIELDPMNPVAYDLKGYSLFRNGEFQKAVEALERSIELDPAYIWGHYNLALAYWATGERSKAVAEVKKILELDPSFRHVIMGDGQFNKFKVSPEYRALLSGH